MLYIHIGLPKTATTSLQYAFKNKISGIHYEGVVQPRHLSQGDIYLRVNKWVNNIEGSLGSEKNNIISLLSTELEKYNDILISEEMFCVDQEGVTWQEKLTRLNLLLLEIDFKVIVSVREPIAASYSLYVELYKKLRDKYINFYDFFNKSNQAKIYKYKYLYGFLNDTFGSDKVHFISFEEITSEIGISRNKLFSGREWNGSDLNIKIIKSNFKKSGKVGYREKTENLGKILNFIIPKKILIQIKKLFGKKKIAYINKILGKIKVPFSAAEIPFPEIGLYRDICSEDNLFFTNKTGIRFFSEDLENK